MSKLNRDTATVILERVKSIPDDAEPKWGSLRKNTLIEHLIWAMRSSMDTSKELPYQGNFLLKYVAGPLLKRGIIPFPKGVKFKGDTGETVDVTVPGNIDELRDVIETFVKGVEEGGLKTAAHPVFGQLGPKDWALFHYQHFQHHLGQFGA
jgi:hypothetical protein